MESMARILPDSESSPSIEIIGATKDADVIMATVEEPCAVFIITAITKGTISPMLVPARNVPRACPVPVALMTIPNIPPAAVTIRIGPAFSIASVKTEFIESIVFSFKRNKARKAPIARANTGSPGKKKIFERMVSLPLSRRLMVDFIVISNSGITIGRNDKNGDGRSLKVISDPDSISFAGRYFFPLSSICSRNMQQVHRVLQALNLQ